MRILVIGGTGFVGPHIVRRLVGRGHEVLAFHRGQTEAELPPEVVHLHGDRQKRVVMGEPDLPGTILRLPMVYGPEDDAHRLFPYLKRMDDSRSVILMAEVRSRWLWARGYVEDIAEAVVSAGLDDRAAERVYKTSVRRTP
ncbi:MAG TPA: NAD-dependent epimerase/dehydratase family protein [Isosphaeraceae bacterium]|nr:NAD-dependent epimerase/dehydratase family protein [Isosphaeraceae bacterium]